MSATEPTAVTLSGLALGHPLQHKVSEGSPDSGTRCFAGGLPYRSLGERPAQRDNTSGVLKTIGSLQAGAVILLVMFTILLAGCRPLAPGPQSPVPSVDTGIDSAAWAQIPAGTFHFGQHDEMVTLTAPYKMMVTDVTNALVRASSERGTRRGRGEDRRRQRGRVLSWRRVPWPQARG